LKYLEFYRARITNLPSPNERNEVLVPCVFHPDKTPSLSINLDDSRWRCFAPHCPGHKGGNAKRFDDLMSGAVPGFTAVTEEIPAQVVDGYHKILLDNQEKLKWLQEARGLTLDTIKKFKIGFDSERYTIPSYEDGKLVNLRKYKPGAKKDKVINHKDVVGGHGKPRLLPDIKDSPSDGPIYLMEGEMDMLLARQLGYPAHTVTAGSGQWHSSIDKHFVNREVLICYDCDKAGKSGAEVIGQRLLKVGAKVRIIDLGLPGTHEAKDFTNFFHDRGQPLDRCRDEFRLAVDQATPVVADVLEVREPESTTSEIHLSEIGEERFVGKRVQATVLIAGKDLAPFQVPRRVAYRCDGGEKICGRCGIAQAGQKLDVEFKEWNRELLEMVNVPIEKLDSILAQAAKVPFKCRKFEYEVKEYANVEAIKAIPEIDFTSEQSAYVIRNLFYLGHGLETNKTYTIEAVVGPEPKTQYATALIYEATPAEDTIEKFEMTDELLKRLDVFKVKE
jgi:hypothetical protein